MRFFSPLILAVLAAASLAKADLPSPRLDRIQPLGAAAGSECEIEVQGSDLDEAKGLLFDHPGLTASLVAGKDSKKFKVKIAGDIPPGTYDVRVVGRFGISSPRLFAVSKGLTDVAEKEPNNEAEKAQVVAVNSAVNGSSDGNAEDWFRFPLKKGQRITVDCQAGKLDSAMDAQLNLLSPDGQLLAASGDYNGRDPFVDIIAPVDGEYLVNVADLSFRGGYPYRLVISDRPSVENVFPRVIQAGQSVELVALGRNFGSAGAASKEQIVGQPPLEEFKFSVTAPGDILTRGAYRFLEHPTNHTVLPTAATCTLNGFQVEPKFGEFSAGGVPMLVVDTPVVREAEPNDDREKPQSLSLPIVLAGRFDRERDADWFTFETTDGGQHSFDVYCERISGRADPYLVILDEKGNRVSEIDDFGHRTNAFDGHIRDVSGQVSLNAKQKYRVLVQDRYRRGGPRYQYVLTIHKPQPDFYAAVIHSQNPGPGAMNIWRGGAAWFDVSVHQKDGFAGPLTITAENLPAGVHASPVVMQNATSGAFVVWADDNAAETEAYFDLVAKSKVDGKEIVREVRPYARVWSSTDMNSSRPTRRAALSIRDKAPYSLRFAQERIEIAAGGKGEVKLLLNRIWPEFKNDVNIQGINIPGQIKPQLAKISAGQTEIAVPIEIQNGTKPGEYSIVVTGQAQVPFNKNAMATDRPNTLVTLPSQPLTVVVLEGKKK